MLVILHPGLLFAAQSQRSTNPNDAVQSALSAGKTLRQAGRFDEAISEFERALSLARKNDNADQVVRALLLISAARLLTFRYRSAMASAQEAEQVARKSSLYALAGGASGTISTIYFQLGDFAAATEEGRRAIEYLKQAPESDRQRSPFMARALQVLAVVDFKQGMIAEGMKLSDEAIALAQRLGDKQLESFMWDVRASAMLLNALNDNEIKEVATALGKAFALREALHDSDGLAVTKAHLAELELKRPVPQYGAALKLIDEAAATGGTQLHELPHFDFLHIRGLCLLGAGNKKQALEEFRRAVDAAETWRQGALPGDTTNTQMVVKLDEVYRDYAHLAAEISLEERNQSLARSALEVLAANRAASLREQLRNALAKDSKFPDEYFKKLNDLQTAQARVTFATNHKGSEVEAAKIRAELAHFENQIYISSKNYFSEEKNLRRNSLRDIQTRLRKQQLLLSFSLGAKQSYLWAVSGDQVNLYRLANRQVIDSQAAQATNAVRERAAIGNTNNLYDEATRNLSKTLFGALPVSIASKPEWLIVGDGTLLNGVPFAALREALPGAPCLLEKHSLRLLPSETLLLAPAANQMQHRFIGVADPVYNRADARLSHDRPSAEARDATSISLARLVGSSKEVRSSAQESGLPALSILEGAAASGDSLRRELAVPPEVVHFAVHVVSPPDRAEQAALALSLKNGLPELLTPETIATYRLPGSLIVLSGCDSGQGKPAPSAGLLGLSRAWLLAGAAAVVVSSWPTTDGSGQFFSSFYRHLRSIAQGSAGQRAAAALRETQIEMQRSSGFTSSPSFWAAFSVISKE